MNTISFPRIFNPITGKTNLVTDEDSINNCLDLLFSTTVGELFGDPQFGCDLVSLFYEYQKCENRVKKTQTLSQLTSTPGQRGKVRFRC